ncbi:hypothetical protein ACHAWF_015055, partial [Thalassiosira exigua]
MQRMLYIECKFFPFVLIHRIHRRVQLPLLKTLQPPQSSVFHIDLHLLQILQLCIVRLRPLLVRRGLGALVKYILPQLELVGFRAPVLPRDIVPGEQGHEVLVLVFVAGLGLNDDGPCISLGLLLQLADFLVLRHQLYLCFSSINLHALEVVVGGEMSPAGRGELGAVGFCFGEQSDPLLRMGLRDMLWLDHLADGPLEEIANVSKAVQNLDGQTISLLHNPHQGVGLIVGVANFTANLLVVHAFPRERCCAHLLPRSLACSDGKAPFERAVFDRNDQLGLRIFSSENNEAYKPWRQRDRDLLSDS